jgi:hypothetical protein
MPGLLRCRGLAETFFRPDSQAMGYMLFSVDFARISVFEAFTMRLGNGNQGRHDWRPVLVPLSRASAAAIAISCVRGACNKLPMGVSKIHPAIFGTPAEDRFAI